MAKKTLPSVWFKIMRVIHDLENTGVDFFSLFDICVKSGSNTLFWHDNWFGSVNIISMFPSLYDLDKKKSLVLFLRDWILLCLIGLEKGLLVIKLRLMS